MNRSPHPARLVLVHRRLSVAEAARAMSVHPSVLGRWLNRTQPMPLARRHELADWLAWPDGDLGGLFHDDAPRPRHHDTEDAAHASRTGS